MKDTIYRDDAVALVIKAIHGTDNKEIQNYLMDGLRKQMWALPSAEPSLKAIKRQIDEHWYLDAPSAEAENESCGTCKYFETSHREYPCSDCTVGNSHYVSAEAVQGWIPFKKRPLTDEEKQEYPDWTYIFDCPLPDDEEEILLSNGKYVWTDTFINDGECYLDGGDDIDDGMAWMPLPTPYKGGDDK